MRQGKHDISLSIPIVGEEEQESLRAVIESGWLSMGAKVQEFESAFASLHDHKDAVALSSCTGALHLILSALGIGAGDEVLVPAVTFVATVNAILYVGATPVFLDIENAPAQPPGFGQDQSNARCVGTNGDTGKTVPFCRGREMRRDFVRRDIGQVEGTVLSGHGDRQ